MRDCSFSRGQALQNPPSSKSKFCPISQKCARLLTMTGSCRGAAVESSCPEGVSVVSRPSRSPASHSGSAEGRHW